MRRNISGQYVGVQMLNAADGTPFTGSASVYVTGDAGTQTSGAGTAPAHEGNGFHTYGPTQAETNYTHIGFTFTGTGAIPVTVQVYTTSYDSSGRADVGAYGGTAGTFSGGRPEVNSTHLAGTAYGSADLSSTMKTSVSTAVWDAATATYGAAGSYGLLVENNLDASVSSRMATYTQPTGFLAATFPTTVASPTNITAATGIVLSGVTHTGAVIPTVSTLTGHTPQTGDNYARLGAPAGASVSADIAAIKTDTGNLVTRITSSLFSGITSLAQWLGLLAGKQTGNTTARTEIRATGAGSGTFDETTDSQEAIRDRGDSSWVTATGFSTHTAADVWAVATRQLTGTQTFNLTGNITGNLSGSVGSVTGAVGSVTGNVGGNVVGSVASVTGAVGSVTAGVTVTTNNDKTGYSIASGGIGSGAHAAAELNNIADGILDRNMATGTDSGSPTVRTIRQALRNLRNRVNISGGTATIYKEDDSTASWTAAVTTTAGNPISQIDPA